MTAPQRVLIGCETSGMVRREFLAAGRSNRHITTLNRRPL
jgi:hypothetical protein